MDTFSDLKIIFDKNGICNYCHRAQEQENLHRLQQDELPWVIDRIRKRGKGRAYDAVIGLSGGVDSSYALLRCVRDYNLRVFTYSVDNGWNTPQADENIMKLVEGLKVPFYRYTIDRERFRELQHAFIMSGVPNIEIPTDHLITSVAWEMARRHGVKTILSGGNWQTESIMPEAFGYSAHDLYHIQQIYKIFAGKKLRGLPTTSLPQYLWYRCVKKIKIVNILDHMDYNREKAQKELEDELGWTRYGEKHEESIFTKWFQQWYLRYLHGLDKRRPHLSSMIHSGQMNRKQALDELEKPFILHNDDVVDGIKFLVENFGPQLAASLERHAHEDYPNHAKLRRWAWKFYRYF